MGRTLNTFRLWGPNLMFIASRVGWLGSEEKSEICSGFPCLFVFQEKRKKKVLVMLAVCHKGGKARQELSCFPVRSRTLLFMCRSYS